MDKKNTLKQRSAFTLNLKSLMVATGACFSVMCNLNVVSAQELSDAEAEAIAGEIIDGVEGQVNASTVFTNATSFSSGRFAPRSDARREDGDYSLEVSRLPFEIPLLNCPEQQNFEPYIIGGLSSLRYTTSIDPVVGFGPSNFYRMKSWAAQLGFGVHAHPFEGFTISPEFSLSYSRLDARTNFDNPLDGAVLEPLNKDVFNWDGEVLTYQPGIKAEYELPLDQSFKVIPSVAYTYLRNDALSSSSIIVDALKSTASVIRSSIRVEVPFGKETFGREFTAKPFVSRVDLTGSANRGFGTSYFHEVGADVSIPVDSGVVTAVSIGGAYTYEDDFDGWRLGVGASF